MDREWNDNQPIYRQLRDRVVAMILDGVLKEGDPLPSVRNVAAEYRVNPLTVLKGYQQLVDEQLVESRRGLRHVHQCGCAQSAAARRTPEVSGRRMAEGLRNHSAARTEAGRTAERRRPLAASNAIAERFRGGEAKP